MEAFNLAGGEIDPIQSGAGKIAFAPICASEAGFAQAGIGHVCLRQPAILNGGVFPLGFGEDGVFQNTAEPAGKFQMREAEVA